MPCPQQFHKLQMNNNFSESLQELRRNWHFQNHSHRETWAGRDLWRYLAQPTAPEKLSSKLWVLQLAQPACLAPEEELQLQFVRVRKRCDMCSTRTCFAHEAAWIQCMLMAPIWPSKKIRWVVVRFFVFSSSQNWSNWGVLNVAFVLFHYQS